MPPPQSKQPDFIPAQPDFIPADGGTAPTNDAPTPPGALSRFGSAALNATGIPAIYHAFTDPETDQEKMSPYDTDQQTMGRGVHRIASGLMQNIRDTGHNYIEDAKNGDEMKGIADLSSGIFGGVPKDVAEKVHAGDYAGAAGEGGGLAAAIAAPDLLPRAIDAIPRTGRAGATLESLDKQLADVPVNLNHSAAPMQRAAELSVRTGASPTPFNAFLSRSQGIEPMTFPEARDYQSGMANPSVMDRLTTSGKMRGAVKQLNKSFFNDIQDAANTQGLGDQYSQGMSEYKNAARLKTAAKMAGAGAATALVGPHLLKYLKLAAE